MIDLNQYITEKFKISKDIKTDKVNTDTIVSCISDICKIPLTWPEEKDIIDEIENWCINNNLETLDQVECSCNLYDMKKKNYNMYDRLQKDDWLKHIKDMSNEEYKNIFLDTSLVKPNAVNSKSDRYGKVYIIQKNILIFELSYCNIYFCFKVKK